LKNEPQSYGNKVGKQWLTISDLYCFGVAVIGESSLKTVIAY